MIGRAPWPRHLEMVAGRVGVLDIGADVEAAVAQFVDHRRGQPAADEDHGLQVVGLSARPRTLAAKSPQPTILPSSRPIGPDGDACRRTSRQRRCRTAATAESAEREDHAAPPLRATTMAAAASTAAAGNPVAAQLPLALEISACAAISRKTGSDMASSKRRRSPSTPGDAPDGGEREGGERHRAGDGDLRAEEGEQAEHVREAAVPVGVLARVLEGRELMLGIPDQVGRDQQQRDRRAPPRCRDASASRAPSARRRRRPHSRAAGRSSRIWR